MKTTIQLRLFDEPEIVAEISDPVLSAEASKLIRSCRGLSEYEQEKILRLSREWIRQEVSRYFGFHNQWMNYNYPSLIREITKYNN